MQASHSAVKCDGLPSAVWGHIWGHVVGHET